MEFEDSLVGQTPASGAEEAGTPLTCAYNLEVSQVTRDVSTEAAACNIDTDSDVESDSDPDYGVANHDMYDSGNDADVSAISDSDSDSYVEVCEDSDDCSSDTNGSSDDEDNVLENPADLADRYLLNNLPKEDTFTDDSNGSDWSGQLSDPLDIDDPFCGFVDRSVVVEYVYTVGWYETMASVLGDRRDSDVHPCIQEHHSTDKLSEDSHVYLDVLD